MFSESSGENLVGFIQYNHFHIIHFQSAAAYYHFYRRSWENQNPGHIISYHVRLGQVVPTTMCTIMHFYRRSWENQNPGHVISYHVRLGQVVPNYNVHAFPEDVQLFIYGGRPTGVHFHWQELAQALDFLSMQIQIQILNNAYTYIVCTYVRMYIYLNKYTYMHKYMHTYIDRYTYIHTYTHTYIDIHTYILSYIHKTLHRQIYIHICIYIHTCRKESIVLMSVRSTCATYWARSLVGTNTIAWQVMLAVPSCCRMLIT